MTSPQYDGPDRRDAALINEVRELREGIVLVGSRVDALAGAVESVNKLTTEQVAVDRRSAEAVYVAATALAAVHDTKTQTDDAATLHREQVTRALRSQRRKFLARIYAIVIAGVAISGGSIFVAVSYAEGQADRQQSIYDICVARSDQSAKVTAYFKRQEPRIMEMPPKQRDQMLTDFALLRSAFPVISCEGVRP